MLTINGFSLKSYIFSPMMMFISLLFQLSVNLFKKLKTYTLDPSKQHPGIPNIHVVTKKGWQVYLNNEHSKTFLDFVVSHLRRTVLSGFSNVYNLTIIGNFIQNTIQ